MFTTVSKFQKFRHRSNYLVTVYTRTYVITHPNVNTEKFVFGIDYGTLVTKVAVYNRKKEKPQILSNIEDDTLYWHSAVAFDEASSTLVTGKRAKNIAREFEGRSVVRLKNIIGRSIKSQDVKLWISDHRFEKRVREASIEDEAWSSTIRSYFSDPSNLRDFDLSSVPDLKISLSKDNSRPYSVTELVSVTFKSIKMSMNKYISEMHGDTSGPPEAYLSVPMTFPLESRIALLQAAEIAGIKILKLVEEPIAALYNVRRLENYGWYSFVDVGDIMRSYMVRVFDGKYDIFEKSYFEFPELMSVADRAFYKYIKSRLFCAPLLSFRFSKELAKLFDMVMDGLIDSPDYELPQGNSIYRALPYVSREARHLTTFYDIRQVDFEEMLTRHISKVVPVESVTHPVLIGGSSLSYPEISNKLERFWDTRLADTVANPVHGISVGLALKAAHDSRLIQQILRVTGVDFFGRPILLETDCCIHDHIHPGSHASSYPFPHAISFANLTALHPVEPLLPAFHEEQLYNDNHKKPFPALSFALERDPLSLSPEYWARLSIQTPHSPPKMRTENESYIPKEPPIFRLYTTNDPVPDFIQNEILLDSEPTVEDVVPDVRICFALNLTNNPLYDTSRDISMTDDVTFEKLLSDHPDCALRWYRGSLRQDVEYSSQEARIEKDSRIDILKHIQRQKNTHGRFFRSQNRAYDVIQFIMSNLNPPDCVALISAGSLGVQTLNAMAPMKSLDKQAFMDKIADADTLGRADRRFADVIKHAHVLMLDYMERLKKEEEARMKAEIEQMKEKVSGESPEEVEEDAQPATSETDQFDPIGFMTGDIGSDRARFRVGGYVDTSEWEYPGIDPEIYKEWWQTYAALEKKLKDGAGAGSSESREEEEEEAKHEKSEGSNSRDGTSDESDEISESYLREQSKSEVEFLRGLLKRMIERRSLKQEFGTQYRVVIVTDSVPSESCVRDIEDVMQRAVADKVFVSFLTFDGPQYDGAIMQTIGRVRGARLLRLWRQHLWSTQFRRHWVNQSVLYRNFADSGIRDVSVQVSFENYKVEKVYGGYMTAKEKSRLETLRQGSVLRFKVGSLYPSYSVIPGPTPPEANAMNMLVKLKPVENFGSERGIDAGWRYDPSTPADPSVKALSTVLVQRPSQYSAVRWDITWKDGFGEKKRTRATLRLTDFNTEVGYADEPGIQKLITIAKFTDFMRKVLYYPIQLGFAKSGLSESDVLMFEKDDLATGIRPITQKQEEELTQVHQERSGDVVRIVREWLERNKSTVIHPDYQDLVAAFAAHVCKKELKLPPIFLKKHNLVWELLCQYRRQPRVPFGERFRVWRLRWRHRREAERWFLTEKGRLKELDARTLVAQTPPKWLGRLLNEEQLDASKDRRNAIIMANLMNELEVYPRSVMPPIHPTDVWVTNFETASMTAYRHMEMDSESEVPAVTHEAGLKVIRQQVGEEIWKKIEPYQREIDLVKERKNFDFLSPFGFLDVTNTSAFVQVLRTLVRAQRASDELIEENLHLGPRYYTIDELESYYNRDLRHGMTPVQHEKALSLFKRARRLHRKEDAELSRRVRSYREWKASREEQVGRVKTVPSRLLEMVERLQDEELSQAERLHAVSDLNSLEQRALDCNHALLRHLLDRNVSLSSLKGASRESVLGFLEGVLPPGFFESEMREAKRVKFVDRGPTPREVLEDRRSRDADRSVAEEVAREARSRGEEPELYLEKMHLRTELSSAREYKSVDEVYGGASPLEVELGNVPIDWEARLERLKELAISRVLIEEERRAEKFKEYRQRMRDYYTELAQKHVDNMVFRYALMSREERIPKLMDESNMDESFSEPDFEVDLNTYVMLIAAQYYVLRREAKIEFSFFEDPKKNRWITKRVAQLAPALKRLHLMSSETAEALVDPVKYWYRGTDYWDDYWDVEYRVTGEVRPLKDVYKRIRYVQQYMSESGGQVMRFRVSGGEGSETVVSENLGGEGGEAGERSEGVEGEFCEASGGDEAGAAGGDGREGVDLDEAEKVDGGERGEGSSRSWAGSERVADPYDRSDFSSLWDYHLYRLQKRRRIMSFNPAEVEAQRLCAPPLLWSEIADPETGEIDWKLYREIDSQYLRVPNARSVSMASNPGILMEDQFGRLDPLEVSELEIIQEERTALSMLDAESSDDVSQVPEALESIRRKHANAEAIVRERKRKLEKERFWELEKIDPDSPEVYNAKRDAWDEREFMKSVADGVGPRAVERRRLRAREEEEKLAKSYEREVFRTQLMHVYYSNDANMKTYCDRLLQIRANLRDSLYLRTFDELPVDSPTMLSEIEKWDKSLVDDTYPLISWKYVSFLGFHIPVLLDTDQTSLFGFRFFSKFSLPSPYQVLESPLANTFFVDPDGARDPPLPDTQLELARDALISLYRFPLDRLSCSVRKALEERYGVAVRRLDGLTTLERKVRQDWIRLESRIREGWNEPFRPEIEVVNVRMDADQARDEAVRLVKTGIELEEGTRSAPPEEGNREDWWSRWKKQWADSKREALENLEAEMKFGIGERIFQNDQISDSNLQQSEPNKRDGGGPESPPSIWSTVAKIADQKARSDLDRDVRFYQKVRAAYRQCAVDTRRVNKFLDWFAAEQQNLKNRVHCRTVPLASLDFDLLLPLSELGEHSADDVRVDVDVHHFATIEKLAAKVGMSGKRTARQISRSKRLDAYLSKLSVEKRQIWESALDGLCYCRSHYHRKYQGRKWEIEYKRWLRNLEDSQMKPLTKVDRLDALNRKDPQELTLEDLDRAQAASTKPTLHYASSLSTSRADNSALTLTREFWKQKQQALDAEERERDDKDDEGAGDPETEASSKQEKENSEDEETEESEEDDSDSENDDEYEVTDEECKKLLRRIKYL